MAASNYSKQASKQWCHYFMIVERDGLLFWKVEVALQVRRTGAQGGITAWYVENPRFNPDSSRQKPWRAPASYYRQYWAGWSQWSNLVYGSFKRNEHFTIQSASSRGESSFLDVMLAQPFPDHCHHPSSVVKRSFFHFVLMKEVYVMLCRPYENVPLCPSSPFISDAC